jgi:hypothetical protein
MKEQLIIVGLIAGLLVAHQAGYLIGRSVRGTDEAFDRQVGIVRGAMLALVAFLTGFAFSGAGSRLVDRADLIVKEANALGTAWLRTDLVDPAVRPELKTVLRSYTADRARMLGGADEAEISGLLAKVDDLHRRMWSLAVKGTEANGNAMRLVLPAINEVIDLHTTHLATARRHLPPVILGVLIVTALLAFAMVGFGGGRIGRRFLLLDSAYGAVLALGFLMVVDMDYPRHGLIRLGNGPIAATLASMN